MKANSSSCDVLIVGGGIVGLATAAKLLQQHPDLSVTVLEKEPEVACHQSGRNSGVIHSGVYYRPGSLKAELCQRGRQQLLDFCLEHELKYDLCGKVIVAVEEPEFEMLDTLEARGQQNGVDVEALDQQALAEHEPHARGLRALHVPSAGIVDFKAVAQRLAEVVNAAPTGAVVVDQRVHAVTCARRQLQVETDSERFLARFVVNCAGLQADRLAQLCGQKPPASIVAFRGDYYTLRKEARSLVNHLIYPVPQPGLPFLGVHATRTVSGQVECGPNASLALGREAYDKYQLEPTDLSEALSFPGVWKLLGRYPAVAVRELWQTFSRRAFLVALQRLLPEVTLDMLEPRVAGIRAQALSPDGTLVDDFLLLESEQILSVVNAPSPAATSSFAIAETIASRVLGQVN